MYLGNEEVRSPRVRRIDATGHRRGGQRSARARPSSGRCSLLGESSRRTRSPGRRPPRARDGGQRRSAGRARRHRTTDRTRRKWRPGARPRVPGTQQRVTRVVGDTAPPNPPQKAARRRHPRLLAASDFAGGTEAVHGAGAALHAPSESPRVRVKRWRVGGRPSSLRSLRCRGEDWSSPRRQCTTESHRRTKVFAPTPLQDSAQQWLRRSRTALRLPSGGLLCRERDRRAQPAPSLPV